MKEEKSSNLTNLRPRAPTDASTLLGNSNSTSTITLQSRQDHTFQMFAVLRL